MRRQVKLKITLTLLSLWVLTAGCKGIGTHRSGGAPAMRLAANAEAPGVERREPGKAQASDQVGQAVAEDNRPTVTRLALHEVIQEVVHPNLMAQNTASQPPPPAASPPAGPSAAPATTVTMTPHEASATASPNGSAVAAQAPNNAQPPRAEAVPLPQAIPAEPPLANSESVAASSREPLITLRVDNLEVAKVMEMISRQANIPNILVSPGVSGKITVDLRNMTVDETLRIIAKQCRLQVRRERDVIYISTLAEFRQIEEDDLPVRVYHLNYVKSKDVESMVKPLLSKRGMFTASPDSETGLTTDANKVGDQAKDVKAGGNSMAGGDVVIIQDYREVLTKIDSIIAQIDVQPVQVLIEAVIVSVKLNKGMELGVNFALLDGAGRALGVVGSGAAINAAAGFTPASVLTAGGKLAGNPIEGFAQVEPGLKFGFVDKSTTGFIKALETMGETKVLACPRLLVLNKQRAEIHLGDRLGYSTSTQTQTSTVQTVQFQDVGTQLRLRPFVSSDGIIRMEVRPERSSGIIDTDGIPQINAAQVTTNVMVPDGSTIVIGGLIESEVTNKWAGIPLLSRLPWIGYLFRETIDETKKKELIVILTPHIWRPQAPEALNYLGRPRTLSLDQRVSQRPCEERRDGPTMFELTRPEACPPEACPPAANNTTSNGPTTKAE